MDYTAALAAVGGLSNTRAGWDCYADYLGWQAAEGPAGNNPAYAARNERGMDIATRISKIGAARNR
jgi:hypothetical protein